MLVRIRPVIDRIGREFIICQGFERRTRQVQGVTALDLMKCNIGLGSINALMRLVNDKQLPLHIDKLLQLVMLTAEIQRAFQVLQADKFDAVRQFLSQAFCVLITGHNERLALQGRYLAYKFESRLRANKLDKILIPRICDSGAVRHDQDIAGIVALGRLQALAEVVGCKCFAETGFCVPEEFALFVAHEIVKSLRYSLLLLGTEFIGDRADSIHHALGTAEFGVQRERIIAADAEPLGLFLVAWHRLHTLNALLFEIGVEIAVTEIRPAVGKNSNIAPFGVVRDMRRLELLTDAVFHIVLLGVADLHPAVMVGDRGSGVAITARHSRSGRLNVDISHLFHLLYMNFDEFDLIGGQAVFYVELLVDLGDRLAPVDVAVFGEILEGDVFPFISVKVLCNF